MLDFVTTYGPVALTVLGGLIVALAAVAPLTKSDLDNKLLTGLRKLAALVAALVGHK